MRLALLFLMVISGSSYAVAQKQVVFLVNGDVSARFTQGQLFQCILKNKQYKGGFIEDLNDFSMITTNDTIPFLSIAKIERQQPPKFLSKTGKLLMIGGLGYVAIDQLNAALGYNPPGWNQSDWNALIVAGVGGAMLLIKPKYQRVKPGTAIRTIDYHSKFYLYEKP